MNKQSHSPTTTEVAAALKFGIYLTIISDREFKCCYSCDSLQHHVHANR